MFVLIQFICSKSAALQFGEVVRHSPFAVLGTQSRERDLGKMLLRNRDEFQALPQLIPNGCPVTY